MCRDARLSAGSLLGKCLAAWLIDGGEGPLHFRLVGPPGVGKNELVYYLAREEATLHYHRT